MIAPIVKLRRRNDHVPVVVLRHESEFLCSQVDSHSLKMQSLIAGKRDEQRIGLRSVVRIGHVQVEMDIALRGRAQYVVEHESSVFAGSFTEGPA